MKKLKCGREKTKKNTGAGNERYGAHISYFYSEPNWSYPPPPFPGGGEVLRIRTTFVRIRLRIRHRGPDPDPDP